MYLDYLDYFHGLVVLSSAVISFHECYLYLYSLKTTEGLLMCRLLFITKISSVENCDSVWQ